MKLNRCIILGLILLTWIVPFTFAGLGSTWPTATPEEVGMDSGGIIQLLKFLENPLLHAHSLIMVRDGKIVTEGYFYPYQRSTLHNIYSCTKSVTSVLTGITLDQGYLKSVDQELGEFFPELQTAAPNKARITIRHLLTMTSGLDYTHGETNDKMMESPDWVRFALSLPLRYEPGTHYNYSDCNVHILAAVLQKVTGQSLASYAEKNLFIPLGITDYFWPVDPQGIQHGFSDLCINSLDMAKLGYLYLNDGRWNGKQVVSPAWVKESTRTHTHEGDDGYGYLWWIEKGGFAARGSGGQFIFVMPQAKVVAVFTYGLDDKERESNGYLPKNIRELCFKSNISITPNPQAYQELRETLTGIEAPPVENLATSPLARKVLGRTFRFNNLNHGLNSLAFIPLDDHTLTIRLINNKKPLQFPVGMNGRFIEVKNSPFFRGDTVFIKGYWSNDQTLSIIFEKGERWILTCNFNKSGSKMKFTLTERGKIELKSLEGISQ